MKAGWGRLGDEEPPHSVSSRGSSRGEAGRWQWLEGPVHRMEGGQGTGRDHPGEGCVGLRAESGFGFLHNEKPLKGAEKK